MEVKNKVTVISFFIVIIGVFILNLFLEDKIISDTERRYLVKFSDVTFENMSTKLDEYISDQFIFREEFKVLKAYIEFDILQKQDNNDMFVYNGGIVKNEEISIASINKLTNKINEISNQHLEDMDVYYAIVPDKQNYVPNSYKYNTFNFDELENIVKSSVNSNVSYIDIYDTLHYDSYYKTDSHWRQENIIQTANLILNSMEIGSIDSTFEKHYVEKFEGVYYGQLQYNVENEDLVYLTSDVIENATVYNYETNKYVEVYDKTKLGSKDEYEIFLSGATPLLEINNDEATTEKELIIFRDSFGSSIVPLFIEKYEKITLVDLRYMSSILLEEYISFDNQDVLFMYSTVLFNNSGTIK